MIYSKPSAVSYKLRDRLLSNSLLGAVENSMFLALSFMDSLPLVHPFFSGRKERCWKRAMPVEVLRLDKY